MSDIKKYNYTKNYQKSVIYINIFFSMAAAVFLTAKSTALFSAVFPYSRVLAIMLSGSLAVHLAGMLCGRAAFNTIKFTRPIYVLTELLFLCSAVFCCVFCRSSAGGQVPASALNFITSPSVYILTAAALPFFLGIKSNYFLKVSCGKFFDDKKGSTKYTGFLISGIIAGISVYHFTPVYLSYVVIPAFTAVTLISSVFINLEYNPKDIYAKEIFNEGPTSADSGKDELFFNFLNFSSISIYLFLGASAFIRIYGNTNHNSMLFLSASVLSLLAGYILSSYIRTKPSFIFLETVYPVFFVGFFIFLQTYGNKYPPQTAVLFFAPVCFLFGISIYHSLDALLKNSSQKKAHHIVSISFFVLPAFIFSSLIFVPFTGLSYFILFYITAAANFILPALYLSQNKSEGIRKFAFFSITAAAIPFFIIIHRTFRLPSDGNLFIKNSNSESFHAGEPGETNIFAGGKLMLRNSHYSIHEASCAIISAYSAAGSEKTLILDGYARFYHNKTLDLFKNGMVLNYVPAHFVDFVRPALSGGNVLASQEQNIFFHLSGGKNNFGLILDIPNLFDMSEYKSRFSENYISLVKKNLSANGVYALIIPSGKKYAVERKAVYSKLASSFKNHMFFVFSGSILVLSSDSPDKTAITTESLKRLSEADNGDFCFYEDVHFLSHAASLNLSSAENTLSDSSEYGDTVTDSLYSEYYKDYTIIENPLPIQIIPEENLRAVADKKMRAHSEILSALKRAARYEYESKFDLEMNLLFSLKKFVIGYEIFSGYLDNDLRRKEKLYIREAETFEKSKRWDEAQKLYRAVLVLNSNNFDANYKLGIISIKVQDIDSAFIYLQKALTINPGNDLVNYQMGILLMSKGDYKKALEFLLNASKLGGKGKDTVFFTGFCYENTGDLANALSYYKQAYLSEPQDNDVKTAIDRVSARIESEKNKWKEGEVKKENQIESEEGVTFPLPINEDAVKMRLMDEE